ncbi:MAG: acetate--CoA ligase family protein [Desulfatiglandales bacterium]
MKRFLEYGESVKLLEHYGIGTLHWKSIEHEDEAYDAAWSLSYPVIVKIARGNNPSSFTVVNSQEEMRSVLSKVAFVSSGTGNEADSLYIQKKIKGKEVSIGFIRNAEYPPAVSLSLGGIFSTILNDISYASIPTEKESIQKMADEVGAHVVLNSFELSQLEDSVMKLSRLGMEKKEILEMDIKLVVHDNGALAVDASMIVG